MILFLEKPFNLGGHRSVLAHRSCERRSLRVRSGYRLVDHDVIDCQMIKKFMKRPTQNPAITVPSIKNKTTSLFTIAWRLLPFTTAHQRL